MTGRRIVVAARESKRREERDSELSPLFHRLSNELAIILVNAELLHAKGRNDTHRARAAQVVASVIDAMETAGEIRRSTIGQ
jgi:hypothetical protein